MKNQHQKTAEWWRHVVRSHAMVGLVAMVLSVVSGVALAETAYGTVTVDKAGTIQTANGVLPVSGLLSPEAQAAMRERVLQGSTSLNKRYADCGVGEVTDWSSSKKLLQARQCFLETFDLPQKITHLHGRYPVDVKARLIDGIEVDEVTPQGGINESQQQRVLLYLHGSGGFVDHDLMRQPGAIPVASLGGVRVLGVDHRLSPEGKHADSLADITAVYQAMLKEYPAENIGVFGCSQGGYLTATLIPWLQQRQLPLPGAISIQGESGSAIAMGDLPYMLAAFGGKPFTQPYELTDKRYTDILYFNDSSSSNPVTQPTRFDDTMRLFPPTILMSSLRDGAVSRAVRDHRALLRNGVEAELHLWEGLPHCFQNAFPDIPETRDYWQQMLRFFDKHLGKERLK